MSQNLLYFNLLSWTACFLYHHDKSYVILKKCLKTKEYISHLTNNLILHSKCLFSYQKRDSFNEKEGGGKKKKKEDAHNERKKVNMGVLPPPPDCLYWLLWVRSSLPKCPMGSIGKVRLVSGCEFHSWSQIRLIWSSVYTV